MLDKVWPEADADTDRKKDNRDRRVTTIRKLYGNDRNAGGFGENGWSLLNAIGEYMDHEREGSVKVLAQQSMEIDNLPHRVKKDAHAAILTLA